MRFVFNFRLFIHFLYKEALKLIFIILKYSTHPYFQLITSLKLVYQILKQIFLLIKKTKNLLKYFTRDCLIIFG